MTDAAGGLSLYVHWPYCARICPYCDFNVFKAAGRDDEARALKTAILADLSAQAALTGPRDLVSIFLGGGTPSLMDPDWAGEIVARARRLWRPVPDLEVTLEANPTDAEADRFAAFAAAGVNRLSLGLQSLDGAALRMLGRNHDATEAVRATRIAKAAFPRLSIDIIYARPGQSPDAWAGELRRALDLGPEHVSPYQLTIEAGTAFDRAVRRGTLVPPDEETAAELYETTQAVLEAAGFEAYEVSNHAHGEAARSRHNLAYWHGLDYAGAGPGAHGRLTLRDGRHATHAAARPADYIAAVAAQGTGFAADEILSPVEAAEERLLTGLRIAEGVPFAELVALRLSPTHPEVAELTAQGLIVPDPTRLRATPRGRMVLNWLTGRLATA